MTRYKRRQAVANHDKEIAMNEQQTAEQQEQPAVPMAPLDWTETEDGYEASSSLHDDGSPFTYRIALTGDGNGFCIDATDAELLGYAPDDGREFGSLHAAKDACGRIEATIMLGLTFWGGAASGINAANEMPDTEEGPTISNADADRVFIARQKCKVAQDAEDEANGVYKSAKKLRERLEEELGDLLDDVFAVPDKAEMPLFDVEATEQEPAPSDDWRSMPIVDLNLPDRVVSALGEKDICTIGSLSDWMEKKTDFWAADIPGIGKAAKQQVEEAFAAFWEQHPEYGPSAAEEQEPDGETANEEAEDPVAAE